MKLIAPRIALAVALAAVAAVASAQKITVKLDHVPLKEAMTKLLAGTSEKFRLPRKLEATITLDVKDVLLEEALYQVMLQAGTIYDHGDHVYEVRLMQKPKTEPKEVATFPANAPPISVDYDQSDFRLAAKEILGLCGVRYKIASDLHGIITMSLRNISPETALRNVLYQIDASYLEGPTAISILRLARYNGPTGAPPP